MEKQLLLCLATIVTLVPIIFAANEPRCYTCYGLSNPHDCQTVSSCSSSQFCSVLSKRSASISPQQLLQYFTHKAMTSHDDRHPYIRRRRQIEAPLCTQCCDTDEHCNVDLCRNSLVSRPPGKKCYDCGNQLLNDPSDCRTVRTCASDQMCHVSETVGPSGSRFLVKCLSTAVCGALGNNILFGKRDRYLCRACCDTDYCNIDYCSKIRPLPTDLTTASQTKTTPTATTMSTTTTMKTAPLTAVQNPYDVTREANSFPLSYECQVQGIPSPKYSWRFVDSNGVAKNVDNMVSTTGVVSSLTLDPVVPESEGNYTCIADNGFEKLEISGSLTVFSQLINKFPEIQKADPVELDDVTLKCGFTSYPNATLSWYKIESDGSFNKTTDLDITSDHTEASLRDVVRSQGGEYACVGDNGFRNATGKYVVDVRYPPQFVTNPPDELKAMEHGYLTFPCTAEGNPKPIYSFSFVDANAIPSIVTSAVIFDNNGTLVISDVNPRYANGTLTCTVDNRITGGTIRHSAKILLT